MLSKYYPENQKKWPNPYTQFTIWILKFYYDFLKFKIDLALAFSNVYHMQADSSRDIVIS